MTPSEAPDQFYGMWQRSFMAQGFFMQEDGNGLHAVTIPLVVLEFKSVPLKIHFLLHILPSLFLYIIECIVIYMNSNLVMKETIF